MSVNIVVITNKGQQIWNAPMFQKSDQVVIVAPLSPLPINDRDQVNAYCISPISMNILVETFSLIRSRDIFTGPNGTVHFVTVT